AVSKEHRFANRDSVKLSELENESFIALQKGNSMRDITDDICRENGFEPNINFEIDEPSAMKYYVKANLGVIFTPETTLHLNTDDDLILIRLKDQNRVLTIGLFWSEKRYLSKASMQFRLFTFD